MAVVSIALVLVALVALAAFGLVLVLARRLRDVTERVNKFLPVSEGGLPDPGTPVPEFAAVTADGTPVSHADLAGPARLFACSPPTAPPATTRFPRCATWIPPRSPGRSCSSSARPSSGPHGGVAGRARR